jgi:hypothetical protein
MQKNATNIIFKKKIEQLLAVGLQIEFDIFFLYSTTAAMKCSSRRTKGSLFLFKDLVGVVVCELLGIE